MAQKKEIKMSDLKPNKDAKGGVAHSNQSSSRTQQNRGTLNQNRSALNRGTKIPQ
jgi:hypothetical protein